MASHEIPDRQFVMGTLFVLGNKLQMILDREFAPHELTAKQWLMLVTLGTMFREAPTLKEAAAAMEASHQNAKQIALKLQQNGYLDIREDDSDKRSIRLHLTDKCALLWTRLEGQGLRFLDVMYDNIDEEQLHAARVTLEKVSDNLDHLK